MLFALFERKSFWTKKELIEQTQQPGAYLTEILLDIAVFRKSGEHSGKWELLPARARGNGQLRRRLHLCFCFCFRFFCLWREDGD